MTRATPEQVKIVRQRRKVWVASCIAVGALWVVPWDYHGAIRQECSGQDGNVILDIFRLVFWRYIPAGVYSPVPSLPGLQPRSHARFVSRELLSEMPHEFCRLASSSVVI
jgi:hypothetical protein